MGEAGTPTPVARVQGCECSTPHLLCRAEQSRLLPQHALLTATSPHFETTHTHRSPTVRVIGGLRTALQIRAKVPLRET